MDGDLHICQEDDELRGKIAEMLSELSRSGTADPGKMEATKHHIDLMQGGGQCHLLSSVSSSSNLLGEIEKIEVHHLLKRLDSSSRSRHNGKSCDIRGEGGRFYAIIYELLQVQSGQPPRFLSPTANR